jgi:hypothetical protein
MCAAWYDGQAEVIATCCKISVQRKFRVRQKHAKVHRLVDPSKDSSIMGKQNEKFELSFVACRFRNAVYRSERVSGGSRLYSL